MRLQVRLGKRLRTEETSLSAIVDGHEVSITSRNPDKPISEAQWIAFEARGFASENAARAFGEKLRFSLSIAGLCSRVGVDAGKGQALGRFNEAFLRAKGLLERHQRIAPDIHGISVTPEDGNSIHLLMGMPRVTVLSDPDQFVKALEEVPTAQLAGTDEPGVLESLAMPMGFLNLALMAEDRRGQVVLALSAIESLIRHEKWNGRQKAWIKDAASALEESGDEEMRDVAKRLRDILQYRTTLRQGVFAVLTRNGLEHLKAEWDSVYGLRSELFHGHRSFGRTETNELARKAVDLCITVILAIIRDEGIELPEVATIHFKGLAES
ncbi:MAG: hypothetical protein F4Z96_04460 [Chloroflexi bacterium]|nr:hypothetical protein [Chloroflexota bacterium]